MPDNVKIIEGSKYMWDGESYESKAAVMENIEKYKNEGFQAGMLEEEGKYLIYTRRIVTDIVVEGEPV